MGRQTLDLAGIYPPIPTPFDSDGRLYAPALTENLRRWNQYQLRGYAVLGSNGELVLLSEQERLSVLRIARDAILPDRLMIAGTGCQSTGATVELTKNAAAIGADAALVVTPSYYRGLMTKHALREHFHAVAESSPIPIILYNIPSCTGIDLDAETVAALAEHENIIGIKDSGGNVIKMAEIGRLTGPDFQVLAGSASFLLPALSVGAVGGILALANIAPAQCLQIRQDFLDQKWEQARQMQMRMIPANTAVTRKWGVPAVKAALDMLGMYGGPARPPLLPLSDEKTRKLREILRQARILPEGDVRGGKKAW
ncbi:MAG TPA: dihydrodipicolinate synthase family protein [Candidatus Acetothermia bacterium]|nr:dihydrodipicolinate synthase family protein [Candidatus Acetothermia bacterium]